MKKLSQRNILLISDALKTVGHHEPLEPYYYIEESLYVNEAEKIRNFIEWLYTSNRPYSQYNAQERFQEFITGQYASKEYFDLKVVFTSPFDNKMREKYNIPPSKITKRIDHPTLEEVALKMFSSSPKNDYTFEIVNQDGLTVKTFEQKSVFRKIRRLKKKFSEMAVNGDNSYLNKISG